MRLWLIAAITLGIDQLTKHAVTSSFSPGQSLPLVSPIFHLTYVQNTGAAFGLFKGQAVVFIGLSIGVIGWMLWEILRKHALGHAARWGCALILGGAVGNLIDRVRFGYVIDFLDLRVWPVFNVADSAITIGAVLLVWHTMRPR